MPGSLSSAAEREEGKGRGPWAQCSPWSGPSKPPTLGQAGAAAGASAACGVTWAISLRILSPRGPRAEHGCPRSLQLNCCGSSTLSALTTSILKNNLCPSGSTVISNFFKVRAGGPGRRACSPTWPPPPLGRARAVGGGGAWLLRWHWQGCGRQPSWVVLWPVGVLCWGAGLRPRFC